MPKDTISAIMSRWSCRDFIGQTPSDADLKTIAEAALASPSGMNRQHWRVVVVKNKGLIEEMDAEGMNVIASLPDKSMHERIMGRGGKLFYGAPVMIVLPVKEASPQGAELMDCGIVAENIAIAAAGLGIDSVICGLAAFTFAGSKREYFNKRLGFPEGYEIGIAVLIGYAKEQGRPHEIDLSKLSFIE